MVQIENEVNRTEKEGMVEVVGTSVVVLTNTKE